MFPSRVQHYRPTMEMIKDSMQVTGFALHEISPLCITSRLLDR
jgi:hypothetical protein